jgi:hypothetical protein
MSWVGGRCRLMLVVTVRLRTNCRRVQRVTGRAGSTKVEQGGCSDAADASRAMSVAASLRRSECTGYLRSA